MSVRLQTTVALRSESYAAIANGSGNQLYNGFFSSRAGFRSLGQCNVITFVFSKSFYRREHTNIPATLKVVPESLETCFNNVKSSSSSEESRMHDEYRRSTASVLIGL